MGYHDFVAVPRCPVHRPSAGSCIDPSSRQRGDVLHEKTYFTVFTRWPREVRLFSIEWELIETEAEALAVIKETENAVLVFRNDPDVPRTDVSADIARLIVKDLLARGFEMEMIDLPDFVLKNRTSTDIALISRPARAPTIIGVSDARSPPWLPAE